MIAAFMVTKENPKRDYIDREAAINAAWHNFYPSIDHYCTSVKCATKKDIESIPAADVRPVGLLGQVEWERDTALAQLAEIGKGLGEKMDDVRPVVYCKNCLHWSPNEETAGWCSAWAQVVENPDFFCGDGEEQT